jgi:hypothetical protein
MAASSAGYHESLDLLKPQTLDRHRAIVSLMEELEAVDWYDQRIDATRNEQLASILAHNRDEEKEHAAMVLEWLRRNDPELPDTTEYVVIWPNAALEIITVSTRTHAIRDRESIVLAHALPTANRGELRTKENSSESMRYELTGDSLTLNDGNETVVFQRCESADVPSGETPASRPPSAPVPRDPISGLPERQASR